MKPQVAIVDIVTAVRAGIPAESIGQGGVFQIAPVGDDIVFISFGPDIGLDGEDDLFVLGVGDAGQDGGEVSLAVFAGIEGEIRAEDSCETRLEGVTGDGEGGDMQLALFLWDGVYRAGCGVLSARSGLVDQVYLFVFQGVLCMTRCGQENK